MAPMRTQRARVARLEVAAVALFGLAVMSLSVWRFHKTIN